MRRIITIKDVPQYKYIPYIPPKQVKKRTFNLILVLAICSITLNIMLASLIIIEDVHMRIVDEIKQFDKLLIEK